MDSRPRTARLVEEDGHLVATSPGGGIVTDDDVRHILDELRCRHDLSTALTKAPIDDDGLSSGNGVPSEA